MVTPRAFMGRPVREDIGSANLLDQVIKNSRMIYLLQISCGRLYLSCHIPVRDYLIGERHV